MEPRRRVRGWLLVAATAAILGTALGRDSGIRDAATGEAVPGVSLILPAGYVALSPLSRALDALSLLSTSQHIALWPASRCVSSSGGPRPRIDTARCVSSASWDWLARCSVRWPRRTERQPRFLIPWPRCRPRGRRRPHRFSQSHQRLARRARRSRPNETGPGIAPRDSTSRTCPTTEPTTALHQPR